MSFAPSTAGPRFRARGAALAELALVLPLLVAMGVSSLFFVELVRAKLKLQEAGRYAAWELTSHVLTDFGESTADRHRRAFAVAREQAQRETLSRFHDLDSIEDRAPSNGLVAYRGFEVSLVEKEVPAFDSPLALEGAPGGGPFAGRVLRAANGGAASILRTWGFNPGGQVQAQVTVHLDNLLLPSDLQGHWGGGSLQSLRLENRFTLVASGWHLPDGADAQMRLDDGGPRAGLHRGRSQHGLHRQVERMVFLGLDKSLSGVPGFGQIRRVLGFSAPNPFGTFVVSHNYGLQPANRALRGCTRSFGQGDPAHPAQDGLNNLERYSSLDHPRRKCFDTAPFRDQADYDDSQYVQLFKARGPYFMGCQEPMADDPSEPGPSPWSVGDSNTEKVGCERP